jgi:hypothetical protein
MKHLILLISIVLVSLAQESDIKIHAKMMDKLAVDILQKEKIKIYDPLNSRNYANYLTHSTIVDGCEDADIAVVSIPKQTNGCKNKIILVTKYDLLNEIPDAIGAFYWQKGRPNLVFIRSRLIEKKIRLNNEYSNHIDDQIY